MATLGSDAVRRVGRVAKPHGIRGELLVEVSTDLPELRFAVGSVLFVTSRDNSTRTRTVTAARTHSGRLLVRFEGIDDRDQAEGLRGATLSAELASLPPIEDPDEFYDHQLEGLAALTVSGESIGTVREVVHGAGGELLLIDREDGAEVLVPFVRQIVPEVDLTGGRVLVDPPAGLLDEV